MKDSEKRSSIAEIALINARVGGRQQENGPRPGGVGYQDICSQIELPLNDPRMRELKKIGIPYIWLSIAELVGFDDFLVLWERLDSHFRNHHPDGGVRLGLPGFFTYQRYQRNQYIKSIHQETGLPAKKLKKILKSELNVDISERHIDRVIQNVRKKP